MNFSKFVPSSKLLVGAIGLLLLYVLMQYADNKSWGSRDYMSNFDAVGAGGAHIAPAPTMSAASASSAPAIGGGGSGSGMPSMSSASISSPTDLLPNNAGVHGGWDAALNPGSNGAMPPLTDATSVIGMVSQSLRNPNLQFRSEPIIPPQNVGPWMQSTIEPDRMRKGFEIDDAGFKN